MLSFWWPLFLNPTVIRIARVAVTQTHWSGRLISRCGNPCRLDKRTKSSGSSCGTRASTWDPSITATGWPRHEESDWTVGLCPFMGELLLTRPSGFYSSLPPSSLDSLANADVREEAVIRICAICICEIVWHADGPQWSNGLIIDRYWPGSDYYHPMIYHCGWAVPSLNQPSNDDLQWMQLNGSRMSHMWLYKGYVDSHHLLNQLLCYDNCNRMRIYNWSAEE